MLQSSNGRFQIFWSSKIMFYRCSVWFDPSEPLRTSLGKRECSTGVRTPTLINKYWWEVWTRGVVHLRTSSNFTIGRLGKHLVTGVRCDTCGSTCSTGVRCGSKPPNLQVFLQSGSIPDRCTFPFQRFPILSFEFFTTLWERSETLNTAVPTISNFFKSCGNS